ncbi:MAG TPA: hypothetical protein VMZ22_04185 [Acidimicrobiales bacterium]|nr:hypothetical protein [Acidimicrobiales bacterium]
MSVEINAHDRARVVRRYLSALDASRPGRGPAKTADSLAFRMHQIDTELLSADPVLRLHLTQERIDLHAEQLRLATGAEQLAELEKAFVRVARAYADRHAISYSAWRQVGVDTEVLAKAGIVANKAPRPARQAPPVEPEAVESVGDAPVSPEPVRVAPTRAAAKKEPTKLKAVAKKAPAAAKKTAASKNGAARAVKKADAPLPPEAHLLS